MRDRGCWTSAGLRWGWRAACLGGVAVAIQLAGCVGDRPGGDEALDKLLQPSQQTTGSTRSNPIVIEAESVNEAAWKHAQQLSGVVNRQEGEELGQAKGSVTAARDDSALAGGVSVPSQKSVAVKKIAAGIDRVADGGLGFWERMAEAVGRGWRRAGEETPRPRKDVTGEKPAGVAVMDRASLLTQLESAIRGDDQPAMKRAVELAGLSLVEGSGGVEAGDLASLTESDRKAVEAYRQLISTLGERVGEGRGGLVDWAGLEETAGVSDGERPIRVRRVELCRRVEGYGVYDAFGDHVFLAGREQPMVVYTELDHFESRGSSRELYQVRLTQEVALYNEADGLLVWQEPKYEVVDESRNRRRDFFVVQMVRLPGRLGVGKYLLKVRVTDVQGRCSDERAIPVQLVADTKLAQTTAGGY